MNQGCGFFKWAEDVDTGAQQNGASNNPPPRPLFQSQTVGTANAQNVVCKCGSPASSKTVRRDGPNQGFFNFLLLGVDEKYFFFALLLI